MKMEAVFAVQIPYLVLNMFFSVVASLKVPF